MKYFFTKNNKPVPTDLFRAMSRKRSESRGFTLVESLVAISILLVAITATFSVAQVGLRASNLAKERVTAYFLAQEALEMVKNARDHNNLKRYVNGGNSPSWLEGILGPEQCRSFNCDWSMDLEDPENHEVHLGSFVPCNPDNDLCQLRVDDQGIYNHNPDGALSGFTRQISLEIIEPDQEAIVNVIVLWRGGSERVIIRENIYNWSVPAEL